MVALHKQFPDLSFVIKGAEGFDPKTQRYEPETENQRFRIYRALLAKSFGSETFTHFQYKHSSIYFLVRNSNIETPEQKEARLFNILREKHNMT